MSFVRFRHYRDSGVEWLGEIPGHWDVTRLANLFSEIAEPGSDELPILSVSIHHGVSDDEMDEEELDRKVTRSDDRSKYKRVAPNDLVYNMMRAWQGGFGTVAVPGLVSPAYVVARPRFQFETSYFESLLRTPTAVEEMRRRSRGVTDFRLRLYWEEFKNLRVSVPPRAEQLAIVDFIQDQTNRFDALIDEQRRLIDLLNEKRQAVVRRAVTKGLNPDAPMKPSGIEWLGDVPAHWKVLPLGRLECLVQTGPFGSQLHSDEYVTGGTPVVNPMHMIDGRIVPSDEFTVGKDVLNRLAHQVLRAGDIVFARRGELGRAALVTQNEEGWLCGTGSMILRFDRSRHESSYIARFVSLGVVRQYFESFSIGATMDSISSPTVLAMPVPLPPIQEQQDIVEFVRNQVRRFESLASEAERAIALLQERRAALISAAVTGQIDVRGHESNAASDQARSTAFEVA